MLPVKHTVIYTFFAITSVQNTCFCSVFNALASKNPAKSCYVHCFFHFWPFFHCRKATKMTQNSISIPSCAQTPKNPRKMSKTPPYSGLGAKPFLGPPTKADIATAISTNVIEHLVLLFCPPISTPSPPKRCGRIIELPEVCATYHTVSVYPVLARAHADVYCIIYNYILYCMLLIISLWHPRNRSRHLVFSSLIHSVFSPVLRPGKNQTWTTLLGKKRGSTSHTHTHAK